MKLGEACFLKSGKNITAKEIYVSPKDNLYPCYGGNGLRGYVDKYNYEGDYNLIGRQGALCGNINRVNGKFYATEHAVVVTPLISLDIDWLYFALVGMDLNQYHTGAAQPGLNIDILNNLEIDVPIIGEQIAQATVLNKINGMIRNRKRELEKLDDLIKARFVEMFGDPVNNPKGWQKKQLQELVTDDCTISYGIVQTGDDQEEGVPVFRPVDIVNHIPTRSELKRTTEEISNKYKRTILKGRELLITVRANIADTYIVGEDFSGCNVGRGIVPIRTNEDVITLEFLKHQIESKHLNDNIKALAKGITLIQLNMEDLRELCLIVPPLSEQQSFVRFAKQVDKSKAQVQKALNETQLLFDSLMQKYFG